MLLFAQEKMSTGEAAAFLTVVGISVGPKLKKQVAAMQRKLELDALGN